MSGSAQYESGHTLGYTNNNSAPSIPGKSAAQVIVDVGIDVSDLPCGAAYGVNG